ncbi:MAG: T9SS type A sorting domain-containing protein [Phaeodactylibacter sp.]|nr:T9SS type A sorting domain-containing protein [Phaeodactylibacter sp.]
MTMRIAWLMAILFIVVQLPAQYSVTGADTPAFGPEELIEDVCLGEGIQVLDIAYAGVPAAVGRFSGGAGVIGLDQGFVMTTGFAATASGGPGSDLPSSWDVNIPNGSAASYAGLLPLANDEIFDVAVYTIRFIPTGDSIMFRYVFASDEYPTFVCTKFNDVFGFFLTGPDQDGNTATINIARVPGTDLPVSINSVNNGNPGDHPFSNLSYCEGDNGSLDNAALFNSTHPNSVPAYNGYTDVFVAKAAVTPCREYTMSLVLADIGDAIWDSGLFFEAESFCSFTGGGQASEEITVIESCSPGLLEVSLDNFPADDFPLSYTITGTAEAGADYTFTGISGSGQVEGPADSWALELTADDDGLEEGVETIEIRLQGATCSEKTVTLRLVDPLRIDGPPEVFCSPQPVTLRAVGDSAALADYPLVWNTGQQGASIQVTPNETKEYILDYGGGPNSCQASFTVVVDNPEEELNLELCSNDEGVVVNGNRYDFYHPTGVEVLEGASYAGCDSTVYINITPRASFHLEEGICPGEGLLVNGTRYDEANPDGLEVIAGGATDGCDSVIYINLTAYSQQSSTLEVTINEGESYMLGGQLFTANGSYELTFTDQNGCDSLVFLRLNVKAQTTVLTDSIAVGQSETLCLDTAIFQSVASFTNVCADPDDGTEWLFSDAGACLEYTGLLPGVDTACLAICDGSGFCDTTLLVVTVLDNMVDPVWPGDVNNDGRVDQVDHWAIGLGYGFTGPVRPNASNAWVPQPMADWPGSLFFIYQFNRKYADCNGDGEINSGDTYAIYTNWGRTHPLRAELPDYPDRAVPMSLERTSLRSDFAEFALSVGEASLPLSGAYGFAFEVHFEPLPAAEVRFSTEGSWLGTEGEDMMALVKTFPEMGYAQVSMVRTDRNPRPGSGTLGIFRLQCPAGDCGQVAVRNIQYLEVTGDAYEIQESTLSPVGSTLQSQVHLYPNPVQERLRVALPSSGDARLFGASGQLMWSGRLQPQENEISVKGFAPGVYVLKILLPEGLVTEKVIVANDKN